MIWCGTASYLVITTILRDIFFSRTCLSPCFKDMWFSELREIHIFVIGSLKSLSKSFRIRLLIIKSSGTRKFIFLLRASWERIGVWFVAHLQQNREFYKKLKNVSCEYDRLNGWNSTLQAAWYIRHVRWTCLFYISFIILQYGFCELNRRHRY